MLKNPFRQPESFRTRLLANVTDTSPANPNLINRPAGMDGWIVNLTIAGAGRVGQGEKAYEVRRGDLLLFAPGVPQHHHYASGEGRWVHLWAYFFPHPNWHDWLQWPARPGGERFLCSYDESVTVRLERRLWELIARVWSATPRHLDLAMNALEEVLLWCDELNPRSLPGRRDRRLQAVLERLGWDYDQSWTVARMAALARLSPSRFSHLFQRELGISPMQYLERVRLQQASERLIMTDLPIADIACQIGFKCPFYFSRRFRRHTGCSPRQFRQTAAG